MCDSVKDLTLGEGPVEEEKKGEEVKTGFFITRGIGFQVAFSNGLLVSVQFGPSNYSDAHESMDILAFMDKVVRLSTWTHRARLAEVAVLWPNGGFVPLDDCDQVKGWQTPDQVGELIASVSGMSAEEVAEAYTLWREAGSPTGLDDLREWREKKKAEVAGLLRDSGWGTLRQLELKEQVDNTLERLTDDQLEGLYELHLGDCRREIRTKLPLRGLISAVKHLKRELLPYLGLVEAKAVIETLRDGPWMARLEADLAADKEEA